MGEALKVSDLVDYKEKDYTLAKETIKELHKLTDEYRDLSENINPVDLDQMKRVFAANLFTLTDIYSRVKAFKADTHTFLGEQRKQFKAETIQLLLDSGVKTTAAGELCYKEPHYTTRINLMESVKKHFILVENMHNYFTLVLQLMQQTVSVVSKEWEANRTNR